MQRIALASALLVFIAGCSDSLGRCEGACVEPDAGIVTGCLAP